MARLLDIAKQIIKAMENLFIKKGGNTFLKICTGGRSKSEHEVRYFSRIRLNNIR